MLRKTPISSDAKHYVNSDLISVILKPDSSPVKRLKQLAEEKGILLNASSGHKTRNVIVLNTGQVVFLFSHRLLRNGLMT